MNMENKKLLVCIAHHYNPEKIIYLKRIVERFLNYKLSVTIIVDTNSYELLKQISYHNVFIYVHTHLNHPYYLTWAHRLHITNFLNNYDYFMYIEDDIDLPFENFIEYLSNFTILFPNYIPSFIRVEELGENYFVVDVQKKQKLKDSDFILLDGKRFITLDRPYHGFWIMPVKELKETMSLDFCSVSIDRELAASYPIRELNKIPLVMLDNNKISPLCYSYHLPNTYVLKEGEEHKFGRIKLDNLLEFSI